MKDLLRLGRFLLKVSLLASIGLSASAQKAAIPPASNASGISQIATTAPTTTDGTTEYLSIPGPLRPFLRMSALSQEIAPEEVLPLLAHHIAVYGYDGPKVKIGQSTEYLTLLQRYIQRSKEMQFLAGKEETVHVADCASAGPLLEIIGYHLRTPCGPDTTVETNDPVRAFITIDSGFPLVDLEETLRGGKPFDYKYPSSRVPLLFTAKAWTGGSDDLLGAFAKDPALSRLYWAMSQIDTNTRNVLGKTPGVRKLIPLAPALEYYATNLTIRDGKVLVPGGAAAEASWKSLVGVSPASPSEFATELMTKDDGWLAAYFDALGRVNQTQQAYFGDPTRIDKFYRALRGNQTKPGAAEPVFRPDSGMVILMARLPLDSNGVPEVPGNLAAWKAVFAQKTDSKLIRQWAGRAREWKQPDELVEGLLGTSRIYAENGPLQIYLALSEIDRRRSPGHKLSAETVQLMASQFATMQTQYASFTEFPALDDSSIARFIHTAQAIDKIVDPTLRADALGIFEANVGLWQIFARQGEIANENLNSSWQQALEPFMKVTSAAALFDAGRTSLSELMKATTTNSAITQAKMIDLLAGPRPADAESERVQLEFLNRIRGAMEDQRLASLDAILGLGDGLIKMSQGSDRVITESFAQDASDIKSLEMPRSIFTSGERDMWASGYKESHHIAMERQTDLAAYVTGSHSAEQLAIARGQLTPYLRDTLSGFLYAYYEPPGAQMLHNNPLLVRTHDFSPLTYDGARHSWQVSALQGGGNTAGNGAHLAGSLSGLPFALAEIEQGFIVPKNVQALTWQEVTPELLISAGLPRWWNTSRNELHAVALYQAAGEELLRSAQQNEQVRQSALAILSDQMYPSRLGTLENALKAGQADQAIPGILPSETFYLALEYRKRFPGRTEGWGTAGKELEDLSIRFPEDVDAARISRDFGAPHPILAESYGDELLNLKILPAFMVYPGRLLGESWESSNLYWARLADEMGYAPVTLNELVPLLTRRMIENIFATNLEDWPALFRAMRETGEEFRQGKIAAVPKINPVQR